MNELNHVIMQWLQNLRTPGGDKFFLTLTQYGEGVWILSALGILFWIFGARVAYRTGFALLIGDLLTGLIKNLCCVPRPWLRFENIWPVARAEWGAFGYSFPSGHTANTALLFGGAAAAARRWWIWIAAIIWIFLMGLSRVYLGVHTPTDILGAFALAAVCIWLMGKVYDWTELRPSLAWVIVLGACLLSALVWGILKLRPIPMDMPYFGQDAYRAAWGTIGLFVSWWIERTYIRFEPARLGWYRIIAVVLGVAVLLLMIQNLRGLLGPWVGREWAGYILAAANPVWIFVVWPLLLRGFYRPPAR